MSGRRIKGAQELPEVLPRATEFTYDQQLVDPVWVLQELQRHPDVLDELLEATDLAKRYGRRRLPGKWALIQLAFTLSGQVDVEAFCNEYRSSPIWTIAGFAEMPTVQTVWNRLTELEPVADAFVAAANKLIRRAVRHEPRIADYVWADGSAFETHARLEHCCGSRAACRAAGGRPAQYLRRATEELVKEQRHEEAAGPEEATLKSETAVDPLAPKPKPASHPRRRRPYRYFEIGGHTYRTLDPDAGARRYQRKGPDRFWFGGNHQVAVSYFVGAPVAFHMFPANEQEYRHWPELLDGIERATGRKPKAVAMDRHYSLKHVFERNTQAGVATVSPWRRTRHQTTRAELDSRWCDRHGVPRCQHCGGPGDFESAGLGFYFARTEPRIRFRCQLRATSDCDKMQSVACAKEWRLLGPLSRRGELYHALGQRDKNYERVFRHWRARYRVAGNGVDSRPKRPGIAWANLRAAAALFLEWFRLSLRHGWTGSHRRRNTAGPIRLKGTERLRRTLASRRKDGLDLPYGPAAVRLGLAATRTPRVRAGPPPDPGPIPF
jgi:hypothetical protein